MPIVELLLDPWNAPDSGCLDDGEDDSGMKAWLGIDNPIQAHFDSDDEGWMQTAVSSVIEALESSSLMICPHFRTTIHRLKHDPNPENKTSCAHCGFSIRICGAAEQKSAFDAPVTLEASWIFVATSTPGHAVRSMIPHLDPDSYGGLSDLGTRHILWCDDRHCATTYERIRAELLFSSSIEASGRATALYHRGRQDLSKLSLVQRVDIETLTLIQMTFRKVSSLELEERFAEERRDVKAALALYGLKP